MAQKRIPKKAIAAIQDYVSTLKKDNLPIKQVILFGSFAKGRQTRGSDIDIRIISPKFKTPWQALQYLWLKRAIKDTEFAIEPIGFSPKDFKQDTPVISEIKKNGVTIKT